MFSTKQTALAFVLTTTTLISSAMGAQDLERLGLDRNSNFNFGHRPSTVDEESPADLAVRRENLRAYFSARRAKLDIVATTVTDSGQILDWIPRESQLPSGALATPPPADLEEASSFDSVSLELETQPHARGPVGTVPVLRREVNEVLDGKNLPPTIQDFLSKYGNANDRTIPTKYEDDPDGEYENPGIDAHEYASTREIRWNHGAMGNINLWNPYVWQSGEFSLGQVALSRGTPLPARQTVEAGWQDYRWLYGDYKPHFFIFFTTNNYQQSGDYIGGYNRDVDGFIQVSSTVYPGAVFNTTSTIDGPQYSVHIRVQLYQGNWWIKCGSSWVGYYPSWMFRSNGMRYRAGSVTWYGEVVDLNDGTNTYTDMGSGRFADEWWRKAAYMRNIKTLRTTGAWHHFNPGFVFESDPLCYSIENRSNSGGSWGSYFYFGGPGRNNDCQ